MMLAMIVLSIVVFKRSAAQNTYHIRRWDIQRSAVVGTTVSKLSTFSSIFAQLKVTHISSMVCGYRFLGLWG
jgi:hypothetical protein